MVSYLNRTDSLGHAVEVLEHGEAEVARERSTAIQWQGSIWDVWDKAALLQAAWRVRFTIQIKIASIESEPRGQVTTNESMSINLHQ
jgi:hypothetical protein